AGSFSIFIRTGSPTIHFAQAKDTNSAMFFSAITLGTESSFVINAASTAQALVYQVPYFLNSDPNVAREMLAIIAADPKVLILGQVIDRVAKTNAAPYSDTAVGQALTDAIQSVASSQATQTLADRLSSAGRQVRGIAPLAIGDSQSV